jgi:hypothetical protein
MFKVSTAILQTFIHTPNCVLEHRQGDTRLTLMPSVIPNSNYVFMVSDWNCLKYFYVFFVLQSSSAKRLFEHPVLILFLGPCIFKRCGRISQQNAQLILWLIYCYFNYSNMFRPLSEAIIKEFKLSWWVTNCCSDLMECYCVDVPASRCGCCGMFSLNIPETPITFLVYSPKSYFLAFWGPFW